MIRLLRKNKGQSTLEYAILVVVVIMALIGIQAYLKRGIQGRMKDASDQIGDQFSSDSSTYNITSTSYANVSEDQNAFTTNTTYNNQWSQRTGTEGVGNYEEEYWQPQK